MSDTYNYKKYLKSIKNEPQTPDIDLPGEVKQEKLPVMAPEMREVLKKYYSPKVLDALTAKSIGDQSVPNWDTDYKQALSEPMDLNKLRSQEEAHKLANGLAKDGINVEDKEVDALTEQLEIFGPTAIEGLAESQKWWQNAKEQLSEKAADVVTDGVTNLSLGLGLLDIVARIDKSVLFNWVLKPLAHTTGATDEATLARIENEIMPKVTLSQPGKEKEFSTATSASLWLMAQKTFGLAEQFSGKITAGAGSLAKITGNEPFGRLLTELGLESVQRGEEREEFVEGQVPALVAGFGRLLPWSEIVERTVPGGVEKFDTMYQYLNDIGVYGKYTMGALATADALGSILLQPTLLFARGAGALPGALRGVTNKIPALNKKIAQITGEVAIRTHRYDDAIDGMQAAQRHYDNISGQVNKAIKESVSTTGRASVRADLYARQIQARRHLNNQKLFMDSFREPSLDEVLVRTPRRAPKALPPPKKGGFNSKLNEEMYKYRQRVLDSGANETAQWDKLDNVGLQQRSILGPDDSEIAGDALDVMVRTGGLGVDDVTLKPIAPEYYVTPAHGPIGTIPWRDVDKAADVVKAERNFVNSLKGLPGPGVPKLEESSLRSLKVQEDIIRRNLGVARQTKHKANIRLYEQHLKLNRAAQEKATGFKADVLKYDDIFLPADTPTIMNTPKRFNRWLNIAGDRVVRSLYPGALRIGYWDSMGGRLHNQIREPQRFFEELDPAMWDKIRSNRLRYDQSVAAWTDMISKEAESAGLIQYRKNFNPLKHWAPYTINKKKDELLFNLLDELKGTPEWDEAAKAAGAPLVKLHNKIREALDLAADAQGIRDSERYLSGYIRHFFTRDQLADGARPLEFMGIPQKIKVWASHLEKRTGEKDFERSAMQALELYGRAMNRKTILEPMYEDIVQAGKRLAKQHNNKAIATYTNDYVATLEGKPTMMGYALDEWIGGVINSKKGIKRPFSSKRILWNPGTVDRGLMGLTSALYAGILTGNPRYPFMQIATAIPTTSMRFGLFRTTKGLWQMATREGQALTKSMGVYKPFLDIFESPAWQRAARLATETVPTVTPFGIMTNAGAERTIRGMTAHAAIDMYLTKLGYATWDEAVQAGMGRTIAYQALRASEEVNHMFGAHGRSPWAVRKLGGSQGISVAITQFLSFTWKQTDELLSNFGRGGIEGMGRIAEYMGVSGWLSSITARHLGVDATRYVGLGYLPQKPSDIRSPTVDAFIQLLEVGAAYNSNDPDRIQRSTEELMGSMDNLIPMMNGYETSSKAARRLLSKELKTAGKEKLRDMDFKDTIPDDLGNLTFGDLAKSIKPEGPTAPFGGEITPTIAGTMDVRETLTRRGYRAARQEHMRFYYNARKAVDDYIDALEDDDPTAASKLAEELGNVYKIRIKGNNRFERLLQARNISRSLRLVDPKLGGDRKLADRYIKIFREYGIPLER